ncbi:YlmC/YmxH family sporulation protein [Salinibacillus xinjiangensis]|uniref:YlmC/YmxH family sporulation protein n=1 Tax=Salinibacillus xinjiangensis TaxID=1229268 RepID=A0A6G1X3E2_9BACI|nr:YlmC/YmxH family sporulation protein [Salinibacillus xinjiangensis]MRG85348.1 YlmC/YmxH family sporulation protein [Salinibacillus xinjiangensis]
MRFKELSGKELIDVSRGTRLGVLGQTDLDIDIKTGKIQSIVVPNYKWFGVKKGEMQAELHWNEIETIGDDMMIVKPYEDRYK